MDADESECKGIQVINYVLAPGMLKRNQKWKLKHQQLTDTASSTI
jgi:hypothetical protein